MVAEDRDVFLVHWSHFCLGHNGLKFYLDYIAIYPSFKLHFITHIYLANSLLRLHFVTLIYRAILPVFGHDLEVLT
jgi:hypothetical protein